ncbi:MAG: dipeptidase [Bacteroidales bacterium]
MNRIILDSHCDTPSMLMEGLSLGKKNSRGQVDFIRMKEGSVDASFFAIFTPNTLTPSKACERAIHMISKVYHQLDINKDKVSLAKSVDDIIKNKEDGRLSILLGMENALPIGKDLNMLYFFYDMGIRYLTLTHSGNNNVCDSCASKEKKWGGLSSFGKTVVQECNKLGILLDCSHISDDSFYDLIKYSEVPFAATHSCCRALCNQPRNLTDQMIIDLAKKGGVVQVNLYPGFLDDNFYTEEYDFLLDELENYQAKYRADLKNEVYKNKYYSLQKRLADYSAPSYKRVIDHIDHIRDLVGCEYIGIGSDFDGISTAPEGLRDISQFSIIAGELKAQGYSEADIDGIMGGNFLRLIKKVQSVVSKR